MAGPDASERRRSHLPAVRPSRLACYLGLKPSPTSYLSRRASPGLPSKKASGAGRRKRSEGKAWTRSPNQITKPARHSSPERDLGVQPRTNSLGTGGRPCISSRLSTTDRDRVVSEAWQSALRFWASSPAAAWLSSRRRLRPQPRPPLTRSRLQWSPLHPSRQLRHLGPPRPHSRHPASCRIGRVSRGASCRSTVLC